MPGMTRPKKGAGLWGRGSLLKPHKMGMIKEFIDGGFPSPGRWAMSRRVLPDDDLARELQGIMKKGLIDSEPLLPGGCLRKTPIGARVRQLPLGPFPEGHRRPGQGGLAHCSGERRIW